MAHLLVRPSNCRSCRVGNYGAIHNHRGPGLTYAYADLPEAANNTDAVDDQRHLPRPRANAPRCVSQYREHHSHEGEKRPSLVAKNLNHYLTTAGNSQGFSKAPRHSTSEGHDEARQRTSGMNGCQKMEKGRKILFVSRTP